jgi:hypothetical protein
MTNINKGYSIHSSTMKRIKAHSAPRLMAVAMNFLKLTVHPPPKPVAAQKIEAAVLADIGALHEVATFIGEAFYAISMRPQPAHRAARKKSFKESEHSLLLLLSLLPVRQ